ncbi:MAG: ACT domain-containing protein [Candidatus Woesearchaeota archaeon]
MVTVSHLVREHINRQPLLQEAILEGIVNFGAVAEKLLPKIEKELQKKVKHSAVVMALHRNAESLSKPVPKKLHMKSEIIIKTNVCDLILAKSPELFERLKKAYELVDYDKGDSLNIVHGNYEVSLVVSERILEQLKKLLFGIKIIDTEKNLVSIALRFSERFVSTPGVIAAITRKLAWNRINIVEIVSTMTELNVIIREKDLSTAYNTLRELVESG